MTKAAFTKTLSKVDATIMRLARLRQNSIIGAILVGAGWALAGLALRAAASSFYGAISGFIILLPAVILAALSAGRVGGWTAMAACLLGGWAVVTLPTPTPCT